MTATFWHHARVRGSRSGRLLALVFSIGWLAPGAMTAGLFLVTGHHHDDEMSTQFALAAVHGHAHEVTEPPHEHPAVAQMWSSQAAPTLDDVAWLAAAAAGTLPPASPAAPAPPPRRLSPDHLFRTHCALKL